MRTNIFKTTKSHETFITTKGGNDSGDTLLGQKIWPLITMPSSIFGLPIYHIMWTGMTV